jgi:hypothetical protein
MADDPVAEALILSKLSDEEVLAGTMFAEAVGDSNQGNSSVEERIAVGCVLRTRLANFRAFTATEPTFRALCLAHTAKGTYQFDCWRPDSGPNHSRLMVQMERLVNGLSLADALLAETLFLAKGIVSGVILDRTNGANFYYAPKSMAPTGAVPSWARNKVPSAHIGDQLFFKL